jgi:flagellar protein FliS
MRGIAAYRQSRVESASPTQIVLMLFQEAVHRLTRATNTLEEGGSEWRPDVHHAREIFLELMGALDHQAAPDLCGNLHRLYQWCINELIECGGSPDQERLKAVLKVTITLLEGWQVVARGGSQSVNVQ